MGWKLPTPFVALLVFLGFEHARVEAVGRVCTAPTNDLLPSSYAGVVAEDTVVVRSRRSGPTCKLNVHSLAFAIFPNNQKRICVW